VRALEIFLRTKEGNRVEPLKEKMEANNKRQQGGQKETNLMLVLCRGKVRFKRDDYKEKKIKEKISNWGSRPTCFQMQVDGCALEQIAE